MEVTIRDGVPADVEGIVRLYDHEIAEGYATFKTEPSDPQAWLDKIEAPDPFLVAELAGAFGAVGGEIVGIAYASPFRPRPAYHLTRETSIFLAPELQGHGLGTEMYAVLLDRLRASGFHTALAMVSLPNDPSVRLHVASGFAEVGTMREVGDKLDRLIDVVVLQLML